MHILSTVYCIRHTRYCLPARRIRVTGSVQGVFYRSHTQAKAEELGITGWVRNTSDGSVEIHAEGSDEALRNLEQWCQVGPPEAHVDRVMAINTEETHCTAFRVER
jgi:acylphosphatase